MCHDFYKAGSGNETKRVSHASFASGFLDIKLRGGIQPAQLQVLMQAIVSRL